MNMTRREFIKKVALVGLLASPVGRYLHAKWTEPRFKVNHGKAPKDYRVGYTGSNFLETGYIYAPYMPLYVAPLVNPDEFRSRRGVMTRYKRGIDPRFYKTVKLA